jgi:UDP-N-acetylglucosamine 2-epimerase (non-hydrolysing)
MVQICGALRKLAERYPHIHLVVPVHRNPNVWEPVHRLLGKVSNITLLPPLDYLTLVHLMMRSYIVITDSGGIQEEAPALGVPALVLREVTERPEGVASGNVKLVGSDPQRIICETARLLDDPYEHLRMARAVNPYGDGHAAERIADALEGA